MKINIDLCIGCEECVPYCTMDVIKVDEVAEIDDEECVECGICLESKVCPVDAIYQDELEWPRAIRSHFSNPKAPHKGTGLTGRGTEEMKTNCVTGRFKEGYFGMGVELGRPGVAAWFHDVEKISMALAPMITGFEEVNPVTAVMSDTKTGKIQDDVLNEKVLSAIIEFIAPLENLEPVINKLREVEKEVDTVFTVSLISKVYPDGSIPTVEIAKKLGFDVPSYCKTNVGLGKIPQKGGN